MEDARGRRRYKLNHDFPVKNNSLICFLVSSFFIIGICHGYEESYSISQMSPKSAIDNEPLNFPDEPQKRKDCTVLETSEPDDAFRIEPSIVPNLDNIDNNVHDSIDKFDENIDDMEHIIVARSAAPILNDRHSRSLAIDDLTSSRDHLNEFDTNDVEVQNKQRYYNQIQPTKTLDYDKDNSEEISSSLLASGLDGDFKMYQSGEYKGVPRGRALPLSEPHIDLNAAQKQNIVTESPKIERTGRQQNHNVQDIITNIVKLLNGNVNVQAATQLPGRPLRPMSTRINNRGPPRISDVPPLPEFENAGPLATPPPQILPPTKFPPPYPFDRPHNHNDYQKPFINGINTADQIGPNGNQNYRPHGNFVQNSRPTNLPPWQRPRPRPPNRRPNPNLPMYKPTQNGPHEIPPHNLQDDFATRPTTDQEFGDKIPQILHSNNPEELYNTHNTNNIQNYEQESTSILSNSVSNITDISITANAKNNSDDNKVTTPQSFMTSTAQTPVKEPETTIPSTVLNETVKTEKPYKQDAEKKKGIYATDKDKILSNKKEDKRKNITNETQTKITSTTEEVETQGFLNLSNEVSSPANDLKPILEPSVLEKLTQSSAVIPIPSPIDSTSYVSSSVATPALEGVSSQSVQTSINTQPTPPHQSFPYHPYKPRPGIVLDDTDFKPKPHHLHTAQSVITAPPAALPDGYGEIFHVTVSAIQGPGSNNGAATVHIENVDPLTGHLEGSPDDIIISPSGEQGFVSIDGKRTYLNLFGDEPSSVVSKPTAVIKPTRVQQLGSTIAVTGSGIAIPTQDVTINPGHVTPAGPGRPQVRPPSGQGHRPPANMGTRRPQAPYRPQPTVRIDTCIVGDDSTCDQTQNERCKTEGGISSCACRPSYARRKDRDPCRRVVAMVLSIRVDRLYDRKVTWDNKLSNKESEPYLQLSYEAVRAVDSAFSMTPYSDEFVSASVNSVYGASAGTDPTHRIKGIYVNCTVLLEESAETVRSNIRADVQRHLLGVITRRSNNVGDSALWVDSPVGSVSPLQDLDECSSPELNDCHHLASCSNVWGGFRCECPDSTKDSYSSQPSKAGRDCSSCPNTHCNNRGTCSYVGDVPACSCSSGYYGSQCEVDGEVLGVSIGASLAALIIIILTLVCLVMWSRRWSREQKTAAGMGSPVFSYMANPIKSPNVGQPPYQVSLEERLRWAQLAEVMAQANHYAQADSGQNMPTRPSSAMFGHNYPPLPQGPMVPPVPLPRHGLHMGSMHHTGTINTMASRGNTIASQGNLYGGLPGYNMHHGADSTSSDTDSHVQDRVDLLGQAQGQGRNFHVPRPKSRGNNSIANQSGIYYDVEYENTPDPIYGTKGIPLSTYTMSRGPPFYRQ